MRPPNRALLALTSLLALSLLIAQAPETTESLQAETVSKTDDPEAYYRLAKKLESQNQLFAALSAYRQAVALAPGRESYALALATLYLQNRLNAQAMRLLEDHLETNPQSSRARLMLAMAYVGGEHYQKAKNLAAETVRQIPESPHGFHILGLSQLGLNSFEQAEDAFTRAIQLAPNFAESYYQLGLLYSKNPESWSGSVEHLQKTLNLGFEDPAIYKTIGLVLTRLGKHEEAAEKLRRSLELDPEYQESHYLLAETYRRLGRNEEAQAALERFEVLSQQTLEKESGVAKSQSYYEEGLQLISADDWDRAYGLFQRALEASPEMDLALYRIAQIDFHRDRTSDAQETIRRAIQLNPWQSEYYFLLASCLQQYDRPEAILAARKAVVLDPEAADSHNLLGNLFFEEGDFEEATSAYRRAVEIEPQNPFFHLNLSSALEKTGALQESQMEKHAYRTLLKQSSPKR